MCRVQRTAGTFTIQFFSSLIPYRGKKFCELARLSFGFVTKSLNFRAGGIDKTIFFMAEMWLNTGYCKKKINKVEKYSHKA